MTTPTQCHHPGRSPYVLPAQRLTVDDHLDRAAACNLGSDSERYHLAAATAEALARIAAALEARP